MEEYWDRLSHRVKSAEAFIMGDKLNNPSSGGAAEAEESGLPSDKIPAVLRWEGHDTPTSGGLSSTTLTMEQLKRTLEDGRCAFRNLILMSTVAFVAGIALLGMAAIAGLFLQRDILSLVFGILGITVLVALFSMKTKEKIQVALANLIQAQAIYLDFYNQLQVWGPAVHHATSAEERRQASEALHQATTFTLKALQEYVETQTLVRAATLPERIRSVLP